MRAIEVLIVAAFVLVVALVYCAVFLTDLQPGLRVACALLAGIVGSGLSFCFGRWTE